MLFNGVNQWTRTSAAPYLSVVVVASLIPRVVPYFDRVGLTFRGQPWGLVAEFALFAAAVLLWFRYDGRPTRSTWLRAILVLMAASWCVHLALMTFHGDNFTHAVWLVLPLLAMVWLKTPTSDDSWRALVVLAWCLAAFLTVTWLLEAAKITVPFPLPEAISEFQQRKYWLPLDGFMGVEGRWTGPFGHNTRAGIAAALVLVIGVARWQRSTVPLVVVGGFFLLVTSVRASYLGVAAAVLLLVIFGQRGVLGRVPAWVKLAVVGLGVVGLGAVFLMGGAGLTGRQNIWPAFWRLFLEYPVLGAGATGINGGEHIVAISGDAHNMFLDEFARNGIIGAVFQLAVLALGLIIIIWAAVRGFPAPAAVLAPYLIASQTDLQNDWIHLGYFYVLVLVTILCAGQWLVESDDIGKRGTHEQREPSDRGVPGGVDAVRPDTSAQLSPGT